MSTEVLENDPLPAAQTTSDAAEEEDVPTIPTEFLCPIGQEIMREPVIVESGMIYERVNIMEWFNLGHETCPLTRMKVDPGKIEPNVKLAETIRLWQKEQPQLPGCSSEVETSPFATCTPEFLMNGPPAPPPPANVLSRAKSLKESRNPDWQVHVLQQLVSKAAQSDKNRESIVNSGFVPLLIQLLFADTDSVRWESAEVLSYLSLEDANRTAIFTAFFKFAPRIGLSVSQSHPDSSIKFLIKTLAKGKVQQQADAAWALWLVSVWDIIRQKMAAVRSIEVLVKALSANHSDCCKIGAARVLRSLAMIPVSLQYFETCNAVPALVFLLHADSSYCRVAACTALCNVALSSRSRTFQDLLSSTVVLDSLHALLLPNALAENRCGCRLVKALAADPRVLPELLEQGCLLAVSRLVENEEQLTVEAACSALLVVAESPVKRVHVALLEDGVILRLASLLGHRSTTVQYAAAKVMATLCRQETINYYRNQQVTDAVMQALQRPSEHVQYQVACIILEYCKSGEKVEALELDDAGSLRALMQLLASNHPKHQQVAASVLKHLAQMENNRPYIAKVGGVHALLDILRASVREHKCVKEATEALSTLARAGSYWRNEIIRAFEGEEAVPPEVPDILFNSV